LRYFLNDKSNWLKMNQVVNKQFLKANHPELATLFNVVEAVYTQSSAPASLSVGDLELQLLALYPRATPALFGPLFASLGSVSVNDSSLLDAVKSIRTREAAADLARRALAVSDGQETPESLQAAVQAYTTEQGELFGSNSSLSGNDFLSDDLEQLVNEQLQGGGLRWRLGSLNRALGPLRSGDFGFLFARPETGKTTFLASELSFMAEQEAEGPVLWFNNEEQGSKVLIRIYQASLGLTTQELVADVPRNRDAYLARTNGSIKFVDDAGITASKVERLCKEFAPRVVVLDQIDKVRGFASDRDDLELAAIYQWGRELAKRYRVPVIGVSQAGSTGDGKRWLTMNDVNNSKTGKQAEADWIMGIGKTYDGGLEAVRYLHLSKNKLSGGPDSDPSLRHGKWEVRIRPEIARYEDFAAAA
jgi:hypothetical protein